MFATMEPMDIRPADVADAAQIATVHVRSWQGAYRGLLPQEYLDRLDLAQRTAMWARALERAGPARGGFLVAGAGEALTGFANFGPARDEAERPGGVGEVYTIYVLPDSWGQGTGRQLMAGALAGLTAAGYTEAILWVLDTNARARRFYEAGGWTADGAVKRGDARGFPLTEVRYRRTLP